MLKRRICGLLLLSICFNSLNFTVIENQFQNKSVETIKKSGGNFSRKFIFGNLVFAERTEKSNNTNDKKVENAFEVKKYSDMYKKAVKDIYDQFEKAYRRNQEIINRSSGLINQTGYQQLLNKQVESEALFKKAFDTAKITKNGDELVFPEFKFDEVTNAVEIFMF